MAAPGIGSAESLRDRNRRRVINALRAAGSVSRAEIARRTGLSRSTISSLITELQAAGLVSEVVGAPRMARGGHGGRPPTVLALDPSAGFALGIDFGHRHLRVAVGDLGHRVLAETAEELRADHHAAEGLDAAVRLVDTVLEQAGVGREQVIGVGMGLPGPIDRATGMVGGPSLLPGWVGVHAGEELGRRLGLPVAVDNDANLGALAEWMWGAGQGCSELAYIKVSTGIGAGLVFGGSLYAGASGTAGEIGHTTIDEAGPVCRCGNRGCLEVLAAAPAILELLRPIRGGDLSLRDAIDLAAAGDPGCRRVIADAGRHIGVAVANLCNLFNPERVVVGGELARAGHLLLDPLRAEVSRGAIQAAAERACIVGGVLGERAEVLGGLALVLGETDRFVSSHVRAMAG